MARKKSPLGCLFYIALVLLVLVVFLFNRSAVQNVLEKTGFLNLFQKESNESPSVIIEVEPEQPEDEPERETVVVTVDKQTPEEKPERPEQPEKKVRRGRLFFIFINDDGAISLKGVIRSIEYTDAPLTSTLKMLLSGPLPAEVNQGLITMLSPDIKLAGITIQGSTAVLDFNEAFRFNSLGKEGLEAQLKQIVYSVTEFSNIKTVQILIEGQRSEYLGPEGILIGAPLSRDSFLP